MAAGLLIVTDNTHTQHVCIHMLPAQHMLILTVPKIKPETTQPALLYIPRVDIMGFDTC